MKKIIAALDFSSATPAVMDHAISLAKSNNADLLLLHVIEPDPAFVTYGFAPGECPDVSSFRGETIRRAKEKMDVLLAQARKEVPQAVSCLPEGRPLPELLRQVKESGADFVVIGSLGHGRLSSLLLGSVAEGMARKATVPTLIVPAPPA